MVEGCAITMCRRRATRLILTRSESILLCAEHRGTWEFSGEFNRARRFVLELVDLRKAQRRLSKRARAAFDARIRKAWLVAMDDFVRRTSQEEWPARSMTRGT